MAESKHIIAIDLTFTEQNPDKNETYRLGISDHGVSYGVIGAPQITMSAASGGGGVVSFEEFLEGQLDDFVLKYFSQKELDQIRAQAKLRLK